ncbi:MAG: hypothetical protein QNJ46_08670 [Leptolyngbyaceae cyanobacterium MO_188.B28]|nr:hypothetical protein [Leptolyngbyaceae cyanobacterium MO_188.B28]
MKIKQLLASFTFSALVLFPGIARGDIDIRTNTTRVTVNPSGDIYINTQRSGIGGPSHSLRQPIYNRSSSRRLYRPAPRSSCHGANDHYQRTYSTVYGNGRSYSRSSTVTRVCR